jgi:predicted transcriptional regulator of viral defense system
MTKRRARRDDIGRLARVARGGLVSVARACEALGLPPRATTLRLSRLARAGWLRRVRRGLYLLLPLEAQAGRTTTVEDSWILAKELFAPCYIGGWSAAEHWGLTEQIFRAVFVVTAAPIRRRSETIAGVGFRLVRTNARRVKAAKPVCRGAERVPVSDREQTLADGLASPDWVGGVRHLADMLATYRGSPEWNPTRLLDSVRAVGMGSARKRFGYLAETLWPDQTAIHKAAIKGLSAGLVKLDPAVASAGRISKRWGLRVNAVVSREAPG